LNRFFLQKSLCLDLRHRPLPSVVCTRKSQRCGNDNCRSQPAMRRFPPAGRYYLSRRSGGTCIGAWNGRR
jgi:hypothetical protein